MKRRNGYLSGAAALFVIVALAVLLAGKQNIVQADPGCTVSTIAGAYGFALNGLVSGSFKGQPQRIGAFFPLAAAGTFSFDGHGNAFRSFTLSFGGQIFPGSSDSGPYTVKSDCTASATFSDGTWNMVIVGHGKEIKAINATPGVLVEGVLTRQSEPRDKD